MNRSINLIDHTINNILLETHNTMQNQDAFFLLEKYGVNAVDLHADVYEFLKHTVKSPLVRVEVEPWKLSLWAQEQGNPPRFEGIILRWTHGDSLEILENAIICAGLIADTISIKLVNSSELTGSHLEQYHVLIMKYEIDSFIYCDSGSCLDPFTVVNKLTEAKGILNCKIEFCAGNECGLATANSLAAIRCHISDIHTVVGGVSLLEGAPMEEIILAVKFFELGMVCENTGDLADDCKKILDYMQLKIPVDKAIIGQGIFSHESGIHVDGIIKNPQLYEIITPEEVGVKRKIIIGKHSGRAAIRTKYQMMGIELKEEEVSVLMKEIRNLALSQNSSLTGKQLMDLYIACSGSD